MKDPVDDYKNVVYMWLAAKTLVILLIIGIVITSCHNNDEVNPEKKPLLSGSTWSQLSTTDAVGRDIYKVIQFTDNSVKIDYRFDKDILYTAIGEFPYIYSDPDFWVKNPDNTLSAGKIVNNQIRFGGELLNKRQNIKK